MDNNILCAARNTVLRVSKMQAVCLRNQKLHNCNELFCFWTARCLLTSAGGKLLS